MNIVANNFMLRYFKKISIFTLDLGSNLKGPQGQKNDTPFGLKIKDEFIKKYQSLNNNKILVKYGEIGTLKFYEDNSLSRLEFHIYDKEKIYEIETKEEDLLKEPGVYLTEVLQMLEDGVVKEEDKTRIIKDVAYTNMPENIDRPDMALPKDQYIEALINRRRLMEKIK